MRKVQFLPNIQIFEQKNTKTVPDFASRYKSVVAKHFIQTAELNMFYNRQFSIFMLLNAKLSYKTMNKLTFRITTKSCNTMYTRSVM